MSSQTGRNDPCGCGSGKKYKDCCGTPKLEVASVRVKDVKAVSYTHLDVYKRQLQAQGRVARAARE